MCNPVYNNCLGVVITVQVCHSTICVGVCLIFVRITDVCVDVHHVETWLDMIVDDCQQPTTSATCMCSLINTYLLL